MMISLKQALHVINVVLDVMVYIKHGIKNSQQIDRFISSQESRPDMMTKLKSFCDALPQRVYLANICMTYSLIGLKSDITFL